MLRTMGLTVGQPGASTRTVVVETRAVSLEQNIDPTNEVVDGGTQIVFTISGSGEGGPLVTRTKGGGVRPAGGHGRHDQGGV